MPNKPAVLSQAALPPGAGKSVDARPALNEAIARWELIDGDGFKKATGLSQQALDGAERASLLYSFEVEEARLYPAFYADARYALNELQALTRALSGLSLGSKWHFFTSAKGSLSFASSESLRTPLQALLDGDFELVKRAANGFAER